MRETYPVNELTRRIQPEYFYLGRQAGEMTFKILPNSMALLFVKIFQKRGEQARVINGMPLLYRIYVKII